MKVTIQFKLMPGLKQITEIKLRIDTKDFVDAVATAINQVLTTTTIEIDRVIIEKDQ